MTTYTMVVFIYLAERDNPSVSIMTLGLSLFACASRRTYRADSVGTLVLSSANPCTRTSATSGLVNFGDGFAPARRMARNFVPDKMYLSSARCGHVFSDAMPSHL